MKSGLPEHEATLISLLKTQGPTLIDGKEWFVDEQGALHYRTIPDLNGDQLSLTLADPHPKDSLFSQKS